MLVFFLLQRLCLLLLPWTAVARPASLGSSGGTLEVRESHKGLGGLGKVGLDVSVTRRAEDAVTAMAALRRAPRLLPRDYPGNVKAPSPFMAEPLSNTTALVSGKIEMVPFDYRVGLLEVVGSIDLSNLDLEVVVYVLEVEVGVFRCNIQRTCEIAIKIKLAKGIVRLYLKNKYEVWLYAALSLPFDKHFKVDRKILVLPSAATVSGNTAVGSVGNGSVGAGISPVVNGENGMLNPPPVAGGNATS